MSIRDKYLDEIAIGVKMRRQLLVDGVFPPDGTPLEGHIPRSGDFASGFDLGVQEAARVILGSVDDRSPGGWRLTDDKGEVIPFFPEGNPDGLPVEKDDGEKDYPKGLIVAFFDKVNS